MAASVVSQSRLTMRKGSMRRLTSFWNMVTNSRKAGEPGLVTVAKAREVGPDLIVMDIQLPYVSGLELIEQMKADPTLAHVPIMAVTAYAGAGDEARIREAGAQAYVSKPISVMNFVDVVRELLSP